MLYVPSVEVSFASSLLLLLLLLLLHLLLLWLLPLLLLQLLLLLWRRLNEAEEEVPAEVVRGLRLQEDVHQDLKAGKVNVLERREKKMWETVGFTKKKVENACLFPPPFSLSPL